MAIEIGQEAPDFTLKGNDDNEHTLSSYRGKPVMLVFYPLDFSPFCIQEHACVKEDLSQLNELNAQIFGISVDSGWAHKAFAEKMGIEYPLLADFQPRGAVAQKFGVYLEEKGISDRVTIFVDAEGKVAAVKEHGVPNPPTTGELVEVLKSIS